MRGASNLSAAALLSLCCAVAASSPTHLIDDPTAWRIVNDGVMGGASTSRLGRAGAGLRFAGELSLPNGGRFASIRRPFDAGGGDAAGLLLRVRGHGNRYRLRVYTRDAAGSENGYSHYADLRHPRRRAASPAAACTPVRRWPGRRRRRRSRRRRRHPFWAAPHRRAAHRRPP